MRNELLDSIADLIKDYRSHQIPVLDSNHVNRWISQFEGTVQVPILRELDHVLHQTYYPKDRIVDLLRTLSHRPPDGSVQSPGSFWEQAHILNIQQNGESQTDIRGLFSNILQDEFGLDINETDADTQTFVYLDDALFTGNRIIQDLASWLPDSPSKSTVYTCVIVSHTGGEYWCESRVQQLAAELKKEVSLKFWRFKLLENRKACRDSAEVLWPMSLPEDDAVKAYFLEDSHKFEFRNPVAHTQERAFSSKAGRKILEDEFLRTGVHIIKGHNQVSQILKPLGFSNFQPGFGSLFAFYRNCPNNTPLALWWGVGDWYSLLPRKTYQQ